MVQPPQALLQILWQVFTPLAAAAIGFIICKVVTMQPIPRRNRPIFRKCCKSLIQAIVNCRVPNMGEVAANLMLTTSQNLDGSQGVAAKEVPELRHRLHPADRRTSATAEGHRATAPQCRAQRATPRRKEAVAQHHVITKNLPNLQLKLKVIEGLIGLRQQNEPRARNIDSMQEAMPVTWIFEDGKGSEPLLGKVQQLQLRFAITNAPTRWLQQDHTSSRPASRSTLATSRLHFSVTMPAMLQLHSTPVTSSPLFCQKSTRDWRFSW